MSVRPSGIRFGQQTAPTPKSSPGSQPRGMSRLGGFVSKPGGMGGKLVFLGALAFLVKWLDSRLKGGKEKLDTELAGIRESFEWRDIQNTFGGHMTTGNSWMDKLGHSMERYMMFGPMDMNVRWAETKKMIDHTINQVLLPCLIPFTFVLGGAYLGFGKGVFTKPVQAIGKIFASRGGKPKPASGAPRATGSPGGKAGSTMAKAAGGPLKSIALKLARHPLHTLIGAGLFTFFAGQVQNAASGNAQHEYMRDLTNTISGH